QADPEISHELFILPRPYPVAFLKVCLAGQLSRAGQVLAPLTSFAPTLMQSLSQSPYSGSIEFEGEIAALFQDVPQTPHLSDDAPGAAIRGFSAAPLSDAIIETIAQHLEGGAGHWSFGCGYQVQGEAVRRLDASAWPRTPGQFSFFLSAGW